MVTSRLVILETNPIVCSIHSSWDCQPGQMDHRGALVSLYPRRYKLDKACALGNENRHEP